MISAGAGWVMVVLFGWLNPFQADLFARWLILGASWLAAALLGAPLWKRLPVPALALGRRCARGRDQLAGSRRHRNPHRRPGHSGRSWPSGLNLRDDRPCSRIREYDSRMPALGLAVAWSALLGTFIGLVSPFWRSEAAIARGEAAHPAAPARL